MIEKVIKSFRCVECNAETAELHRDYRNGILKITICDSCHKPADKYIEYDPIHWKLCVFCLLCEAYLRWSEVHGSESSSDPADLIRYTREWEFYGLFGLAALELCVFSLSVLVFLWFWLVVLRGGTVEVGVVLRALLLSCYGKGLLVPAVIWEHDYSPLCLGLIKIFVLMSNSQALRVILNISRRLALLAVAVGLLVEMGVARACRNVPQSIQDVLAPS